MIIYYMLRNWNMLKLIKRFFVLMINMLRVMCMKYFCINARYNQINEIPICFMFLLVRYIVSFGVFTYHLNLR